MSSEKSPHPDRLVHRWRSERKNRVIGPRLVSPNFNIGREGGGRREATGGNRLIASRFSAE